MRGAIPSPYVDIDIASGAILGTALRREEDSDGVERVVVRAREECEKLLAVLADNGSANRSSAVRRVIDTAAEIGAIFSFPAHPRTKSRLRGRAFDASSVLPSEVERHRWGPTARNSIRTPGLCPVPHHADILRSRNTRAMLIARWLKPRSPSPVYPFHRVLPVAADGTVYFTSVDGECAVFAAGRERRLLATNRVDGPVIATPAISGKAIYIRSRTRLSAFALSRE